MDGRDACVLLNGIWIKALAVVGLGQPKSSGEGLCWESVCGPGVVRIVPIF